MDRAWMGWFWVKRYGYLPPAVWAGGSLRDGRGGGVWRHQSALRTVIVGAGLNPIFGFVQHPNQNKMTENWHPFAKQSTLNLIRFWQRCATPPISRAMMQRLTGNDG
jgi:hypothetical protein